MGNFLGHIVGVHKHTSVVDTDYWRARLMDVERVTKVCASQYSLNGEDHLFLRRKLRIVITHLVPDEPLSEDEDDESHNDEEESEINDDGEHDEQKDDQHTNGADENVK